MAAATTEKKGSYPDKDQTYANGVREAREAKGYGRRTCHEALVEAGVDITRRGLFGLETTGDPKSKEVTDLIKSIKALPTYSSPKKEKAEKPAAKKAAKAPAKAAKAAASDLI